MNDKEENCLICESKEYKPFLEVPNRFDVWEMFILVQCTECGFVYLWPRPEKIETYYDDVGYQPHQDKVRTLMDRMYQWIRVCNLNIKRRLIERYHNYL